MLWGRVDGPWRVSGQGGDLVEHIGKSRRERSDLVCFFSNEIDLLRARSDRVRALPQHVPADFDPRQRHGAVGVGRVDDLELEPIGWLIFESTLKIELARVNRGPGSSLGRISGAMLSQLPSMASLIFVTSASMPLPFG